MFSCNCSFFASFIFNFIPQTIVKFHIEGFIQTIIKINIKCTKFIVWSLLQFAIVTCSGVGWLVPASSVCSCWNFKILFWPVYSYYIYIDQSFYGIQWNLNIWNTYTFIIIYGAGCLVLCMGTVIDYMLIIITQIYIYIMLLLITINSCDIFSVKQWLVSI